MRARWTALALYVAAVYAFLPYGPPFGKALVATTAGAWLLGPGLPLFAALGAAGAIVRLRRRRAPRWAYVALGVAFVSYALAFSWLRSAHLERTHLPEYGVAAWLAWRAVAPMVASPVGGYVAGAALGAAIGVGDELVQRVVPGRVYDPRDVAMNVLGAVLGVLVLAAVRARAASADAAIPAASGVTSPPDTPTARAS